MSIAIALIMLLIGLWLLLKVVGFVFKLAGILLLLAAAWWLFAPTLGLPPPPFA